MQEVIKSLEFIEQSIIDSNDSILKISKNLMDDIGSELGILEFSEKEKESVDTALKNINIALLDIDDGVGEYTFNLTVSEDNLSP